MSFLFTSFAVSKMVQHYQEREDIFDIYFVGFIDDPGTYHRQTGCNKQRHRRFHICRSIISKYRYVEFLFLNGCNIKGQDTARPYFYICNAFSERLKFISAEWNNKLCV